MHEWNLIETMPKTGKYFLVWDENLKAYEVANQPEGYCPGQMVQKQRKELLGGDVTSWLFQSHTLGKIAQMSEAHINERKTNVKIIPMLLLCLAVILGFYALIHILKLGAYALAIFFLLSIPQVRNGIKYLLFK
jgi:hypothetical protein